MNQSDKLKESVSSYIEGELSGELRRQFEQHMAEDAEFKEMVGRTGMVREQLQNLRPVSASAEFDATLRKRMSEFDNGGRILSMPQVNWRGPAIAVAATAVIASTVWFTASEQGVAPTDVAPRDNVGSFAPNISSQSVTIPDNEAPDALVNENEDSLKIKQPGNQAKDNIKLVKDRAPGN